MLGTGLLKGMAETARNFAGSYSSEERMVTVQYPEEREAPKENGRQFPFLVFDGDDWQKGLRCVACQICVEVCPFEAIKMDQEFELSNTDRFEGLLVHKDRLARPNSHYQKIHPTEAAEVDKRLAEEKVKAEAKAKADAEAKAKAAAEAKAKGPVGSTASPQPAAKPVSAPPQPPPATPPPSPANPA